MYVKDLKVRVEWVYVPNAAPHERPLTYVGWLAAGRPFRTGPIDAPVLERLVHLTRDTRRGTRGWHFCDFCPDGKRIWPRVEFAGVEMRVGSSASLLPGKGNVLYTFPDLICHYVIEHGYLPPDEFLDAVMAAPRAAG